MFSTGSFKTKMLTHKFYSDKQNSFGKNITSSEYTVFASLHKIIGQDNTNLLFNKNLVHFS